MTDRAGLIDDFKAWLRQRPRSPLDVTCFIAQQEALGRLSTPDAIALEREYIRQADSAGRGQGEACDE